VYGGTHKIIAIHFFPMAEFCCRWLSSPQAKNRDKESEKEREGKIKRKRKQKIYRKDIYSV
jgi:hypothetical protein